MAFLAAVETKDGLLGLLYCWRIDSCGAAVRASLCLAKFMLHTGAHQQTNHVRITLDLPPFPSPLPVFPLLWTSFVARQSFHL